MVVTAIAAVYFFVFAGQRLLADWDEAIYGDIAREFARGISHMAPFWNYHPWLERTPLFEWLTAAVFAFSGITNAGARAISALAGCATVALCFLWVQRAYGRVTAWWASTILLTSHAFFYQARFGTTDMLLTLWMFLSAYGIYRIDRRERNGWYAFFIGLGLGIMTKSAGPAPVVLTLLVVAFKNRWRLDRFGRPCLWGFLVFLAIVLPWHLYMFSHYGRAFYNDYIVRQLLTRSLRPLEGHTGGPLFYLIAIAKSAAPWSLLLIPAAFHRLRERRLEVTDCYALVIFGFYTLIKTKLPWYITPIYPALAVITAPEITRFVPKPRFALPGLLGIGLCALLFVDLRRPYPRSEVALLAAHRNAPGQTLILCSDRYILDMPAPLFYADRPTVQAYVAQQPSEIEGQGKIDPVTNDPKFRHPQPLETLVTAKDALLLTETNLLPAITARYAWSQIAANERFTLGLIHSR